MRVLKWVGIILGALIGIVALAALTIFVTSNRRMYASYEFEVASLEIPSGEEALALGEHVAIVRGCTDCHSADLGGSILIDEPAIGKIVPTNLTTGNGGVAGNYTDDDWVRAIRHGIGPDNQPLLFMPSHEFFPLSDEDLGSLVAYLKSVPPVDNEVPETTAGPVGRVLFLNGMFDLVPAEKIDHDSPVPPAPEVAASEAYGAYMATGCIGCHGEGYSGGAIPGAPPDWPIATNITPGGNIASWSEAEFMTAMREGKTPEGKTLIAEFMPWPIYSEMTDVELQALYLYLNSLPATESGNR